MLQALLEPDPAKRGTADGLVHSNWFRERPVLNRAVFGRGAKGPFVILEAFLGEDVLAIRGPKSARTYERRILKLGCIKMRPAGAMN